MVAETRLGRRRSRLNRIVRALTKHPKSSLKTQPTESPLMHIQSLHRYPVKSLRGHALNAADITIQGIRGDREWLLATPEGAMLTARKYPQMLLWQADTDPLDGSLHIDFGDGETLHCHTAPFTHPAAVQVWKDHFTAYGGNEAADAAFSRRFGFPVRLYWLGATAQRLLKNVGTPLSFADGAPFLLTNTASLDDLNRQLGGTFEMSRFRANIVLHGELPYQEERWQRVRIGEVIFAATHPCVRCVMTTLDPATAAKHPQQQPLAYLARHRDAVFGINLRAENSGRIQVGDALTVLA